MIITDKKLDEFIRISYEKYISQDVKLTEVSLDYTNERIGCIAFTFVGKEGEYRRRYFRNDEDFDKALKAVRSIDFLEKCPN